MDKKIGGWKDKWLTKLGKIIKIKAVLVAFPTYPLSCLPLSKSLNKKIKAKLRNFFSNDNEEYKNLVLIKWEKLCKPKELGGLGLKNLSWKNEALRAKLTWRLFTERNQNWAKILYNKYLNATDPYSMFRMRSLPKGSKT